MTFSRSPTLLKGALIVLTDTVIGVPLPSLIPFQYNPHTVSRSLEPFKPPRPETPGEGTGTTQRAQPGPPTETISLSLELDATDFMEDPGNHPVGSVFGVGSQVASIEKLMYPMGSILDTIIDAVVGAITSALKLDGGSSEVDRSEVPTVLFFWGPSRIVPVRVTSIKIEEKGHSPVLYPTLATISVTLRVLPPSSFQPTHRGQSLGEKIAIGCYEWTALNRDLLSVAGAIDTVAGIIPD